MGNRRGGAESLDFDPIYMSKERKLSNVEMGEEPEGDGNIERGRFRILVLKSHGGLYETSIDIAICPL